MGNVSVNDLWEKLGISVQERRLHWHDHVKYQSLIVEGTCRWGRSKMWYKVVRKDLQILACWWVDKESRLLLTLLRSSFNIGFPCSIGWTVLAAYLLCLSLSREVFISRALKYWCYVKKNTFVLVPCKIHPKYSVKWLALRKRSSCRNLPKHKLPNPCQHWKQMLNDGEDENKSFFLFRNPSLQNICDIIFFQDGRWGMPMTMFRLLFLVVDQLFHSDQNLLFINIGKDDFAFKFTI